MKTIKLHYLLIAAALFFLQAPFAYAVVPPSNVLDAALSDGPPTKQELLKTVEELQHREQQNLYFLGRLKKQLMGSPNFYSENGWTRSES